MVFDYFYGFFGGDINQWQSTLLANVNQVFHDIGHPGYNLNIDLVDKAAAWLQRINSLKPDQPVFLYHAPGATHAPHQPTPSGSRTSRTSLTVAGMRIVKRSSSVKKSWASSPSTRS